MLIQPLNLMEAFDNLELSDDHSEEKSAANLKNMKTINLKKSSKVHTEDGEVEVSADNG